MQVDLPFIIVSGTIGEETAVEAMCRGARLHGEGEVDAAILAIERELRLAAERAARRQAERALHESEQRFRCSSRTRRSDHGDRFARHHHLFEPLYRTLLGYGPEDLLGKAIFAFVHQERHESHGGRADRAIEQPGSTQSAEFRFKHWDASWRVFESIGKSLLYDATVGGVVVNSRDITERKKAAEALQESNLRLQEALAEVKGMSAAALARSQAGDDGRADRQHRA